MGAVRFLVQNSEGLLVQSCSWLQCGAVNHPSQPPPPPPNHPKLVKQHVYKLGPFVQNCVFVLDYLCDHDIHKILTKAASWFLRL